MAAIWQTPKTDWFGVTDVDGVYTGDRFDAVDFNRIKNNLEWLHEFAKILYNEFTIISVGDDRVYSDYFYANEIMELEANLVSVTNGTIQRNYGTSPSYFDNGHVMDYVELNRIEGAILDLYDRLNNQKNGLRDFTWNFGMKGGEF